MKNKAPILSTPRLILRPFKKKDAYAIFKGWGNDPEVSKYLLWKPNEIVKNVKIFVSSVLGDSQKRLFNWIITLNGKAIGSLAVDKIDYDKKSCEVGYCYAKEYWRKGYASEALKKTLEYLFEIGFHSVKACHHILNPASGAVMKKCGMKYTHTTIIYNPLKKEHFPAHNYIIYKG